MYHPNNKGSIHQAICWRNDAVRGNSLKRLEFLSSILFIACMHTYAAMLSKKTVTAKNSIPK